MYHSPLKLYEYLAMGKPVVASEFSDSKALIKEGYNGFLFKAGQVTELKEKLVQSFNQTKTRGFDTSGIRQEIVTLHSWGARVEVLLRKLSSVLSEQN